MQALKFVFVAVFAVCALQSSAAEIPVSADKVDLRLFVENGAIIAKNLFKAVNTGLDQSKPNMDKILNELAPEAKTMIRNVIDRVRNRINEEEKRVNVIFATLTKALDDLKPIKPCSDKVSPAAKKLALATEKQIVKIIQDVRTKYKKEIDNIKAGAEVTLKKARALFDTEVPAVVKCLTPGKKDSYACLDKEIDKVKKGIVDIGLNILFLIDTANDTLSPMLPEIFEKLMPVIEKVRTDGRALLKTLADCVASMK